MQMQGKKILYYEDQPLMVEIIQLMLEKKMGFLVTNATTPSAVRERLTADRFDLILLDIRIFYDAAKDKPNNGWEREGLHFLEQLRNGELPGETSKSVPVLVITAVVNTADVEKIIEVGGRNKSKCIYMAKPVDLGEVEEAVMELLR